MTKIFDPSDRLTISPRFFHAFRGCSLPDPLFCLTPKSAPLRAACLSDMDSGKFFSYSQLFCLDTEVGSVDGTVMDVFPRSSEDRVDISKPFLEACQMGLEAGELCHGPWFNLMHSMSAIEVMDPKMDIRVQGVRHILSTTEAVCTNVLPLDPFSDHRILIGVMDELLAATTNWLTGDSLAQSVFTCMYMHCTQLVRDPHLRAFCELLRRVIFQTRQIILVAGIFDEEDFYPPTNGMPLKGPSSAFDRFLDVQTLPESTEFFKLTVKGLIEHTEDLISSLPARTTGSSGIMNKYPVVISSRLEFLVGLLRFTDLIVSYMNATGNALKSSSVLSNDDLENHFLHCPEVTVFPEDNTFPSNNFWTNLFTICSAAEPILRKLTQVSKTLLETVTTGLSPGEGRISPKNHSYGLPGFEPFLKQTSLPSYIPRFVVIHDRNHAFRYFCGLTENLLRIFQARLVVTKLHDYDPRASPLHLLWSLARLGGQETHSHVVQLLNGQTCPTVPSGFCSTLPSCLFSRSISCLLYYMSMRYLCAHSMPLNVPGDVQVELILNSWLSLEAEKYRSPLRTIICELVGLKRFFEILADHLIHVSPHIYGRLGFEKAYCAENTCCPNESKFELFRLSVLDFGGKFVMRSSFFVCFFERRSTAVNGAASNAALQLVGRTIKVAGNCHGFQNQI